MTIQFAGVDLLLEDPEGAVRTWLDRHLNELHASIFCTENTAIREARFASITNPGTPVSSSSSSGWPAFDTPTVRRVGLPVGNYPKSPRPRINSLYWPTGATRWANALFLVRGDSLSAVLDACELGKAANLTVADSKGNGLTTGMYLLAPRPVSADGVDPEDRLWLLPLVDARYFWQLYHVDLYAPSTWSEALQKITGISPSDSPQLGSAVPLAYGRPSAVEFVRDFENAALLVDAVALTLQRRVVGQFGPADTYKFMRYKTQTSSEATTTVAANLGHGWDEVAGGDFSSEAGVLGNVPSQIVVTYGNSTGDRVSGYAKKDVTGVPVNGGSKVFHCSTVGSGNISDSGEYLRGFEAKLAAEIEPDYYEWLLFQYDITYAGIVPWVPSGCDDYVRWEMTVKGRGKRRKLVCQTRAVSMPPNFGFESLPLDPLGESSSSSSSRSSSSQSSSSQSSMSSNSSSNSNNSVTSSTSSGSSTSTTSCKCGYSTYLSDGEFWELLFSNCDPAYQVRPSVAPGPAGTTIDVCCRCPSSSSSSQFSSGSSASIGSSGSSASTTSCKCGFTTYQSDGESWGLISSTCDPAYQVRPSVAPGPAGTTVDVCCRCPSSSSSSTASSNSSATSSEASSSASSDTSSNTSSDTSSNTSSDTSSGDSQTKSGSSTTSSQTSSATSSASVGSSTSSRSTGNSESSGTSEASSDSFQPQSSGTSDSQSSESASNTSSVSGSGSGNSGSGSGESGSGGSGSGGSDGGSGGGGSGSGGSDGSEGSTGSSGTSDTSGSGTSSGSWGGSETSSGGSGGGGSSGSGTPGCITVVTGVSCGSGGLSVTYGKAVGC